VKVNGVQFVGTRRTQDEAIKAMGETRVAALAGTAQTKRQAKATSAVARAEAEAAVTVEDYLRGWLATRSDLRQNTVDGYRTIIDQHVAPRIGTVRLADLTRRGVIRLLADLAVPNDRGRVRTASTIARVRSLLSGALEHAVAEELVPTNVARGVSLPRSAARGVVGGHLVQPFTAEELGKVLTAADKTDLGPLLRLAAFTGMRRGELAGLAWADVDLDKGHLTVRASLTQRGAELRWGAPKTDSGARVVTLDANTVEMLRRHELAQREESLKHGRCRWNARGLVFVRRDGSPMRPDSITHGFSVICVQAGVPVRRLHDLRHTHASMALAAGLPTKVVSDRLGHSSTQITENIYQHVDREVAREAAELIAAVSRTGSHDA
jgi:integrase